MPKHKSKARQFNEDIEYFLSLEKAVLLDIEPHLIEEEDGAIMHVCGDCDCFSDIFVHHGRIQRTCRPNERIHTFAGNGGALVLAPHSPLVSRGSTIQEDLFRQTKQAMDWKKIKKIIVAAHYPCGMAKACHLSPEQIILLLFQAKRAMKDRLAEFEPKVSAYFHIDYGLNFKAFKKKKRVLSFYASREGWEKHLGIA